MFHEQCQHDLSPQCMMLAALVRKSNVCPDSVLSTISMRWFMYVALLASWYLSMNRMNMHHGTLGMLDI